MKWKRSCSRVGRALNPAWLVSSQKGEIWTYTLREDWGACCRKLRDFQKVREASNRSLSSTVWGAQPCWHLDFRLLVSRAMTEETKPLLFKPVCEAYLQAQENKYKHIMLLVCEEVTSSSVTGTQLSHDHTNTTEFLPIYCDHLPNYRILPEG